MHCCKVWMLDSNIFNRWLACEKRTSRASPYMDATIKRRFRRLGMPKPEEKSRRALPAIHIVFKNWLQNHICMCMQGDTWEWNG